MLEKSIDELNNVKNNFINCMNTCSDLKMASKDTPVMVPITTSLYVPGKIIDSDAFLIDIGAKFFVEKNRNGAVDYFERKSKFLAGQAETLTKLYGEKLSLRQTFLEVLAYKEQQQQQALLAAQKS